MTARMNAGYEVSLHKKELADIITKIMSEHTARNGCSWVEGAIDGILCDLSKSIERHELCAISKAA